MGFTLSVPDKQYRLDSLAAVGPQTPTDPSTFQGTGAAVGTGVVSGGAAVARTGADLATAYAQSQNIEDSQLASLFTDDPARQQQIQQQSNVYATMRPPFDDQIQAVQDWSKADPSTQGSGARMLGGAAHGLTVFGIGSLFGGPVGSVGTLAPVEGYNDYRDSTTGPNPLDQTTALEKAGITATAAGLGAFLPMKIGSSAATTLAGLGMRAEVGGNSALATSLFGAARAAATVATNPAAKFGTAALINTGFGAANRYATSTILADAGYKDMAAQYAPGDAQSLAADFIMGLAFGVHGEIAPHVEALRDRVANGAAPIDALPPSSMIDAALASRRQDMLVRGGGGVPIDPAHGNLDTGLQNQALESLLRGRDVSVSPDDARSIVDGTVRDPGVRALNDEFLQAMQDHYGMLADFEDVARVPEGPAQSAADVLTRPAAPDAIATGEPVTAAGPLPHLSDFANESLRQIATRRPDMQVDVGDGATVRAADLHQTMAADLAAANDTVKLHDAALACFART